MRTKLNTHVAHSFASHKEGVNNKYATDTTFMRNVTILYISAMENDGGI